MKELHPRQGRHLQDVHRDDPPAVAQCLADPLRPPARRGAQVDDHHARLEQAVALDQFLQLVGGTRAQAFRTRAFHERVGVVLLEPALAAFAAGSHQTKTAGGRAGHDTLRALPNLICVHRWQPS